MPKRFVDTALWTTKPWFRLLSPAEKCAFTFLTVVCDNVGVWVPDFELATFMIGEEIDWDKLIANCNDNIVKLDNGKWFLPDFCEFQYGGLQEETKNPAHLSYIRLLKKHGLWNGQVPTKGLDSGCQVTKEKDKDKDKELEKDKKDARVKILIDYFHDKYVAKTKQKPTVTGQWGRNFKVLLRAHTEETVKRVIDKFFAYDKRVRFSFGDFMRSFDNVLPFATGEPRAGPGKHLYGNCGACGEPLTTTAGFCTKCGHGR